MSLIMSFHVQEGIIMASDSRISISDTKEINGEAVYRDSVSQSDTAYKTFVSPAGFGISYFGRATIATIPISGFIDAFISEKLSDESVDLEDIPQMLVDYFQAFEPVPDTGFHVGGYKEIGGRRIQMLWRVFVLNGSIEKVVPDKQRHGVIWDGEQDVLVRMLNGNMHFCNSQNNYVPIKQHHIPFEMFTLQDAVDFCSYAIRATADLMKFQLRYKTVGGPIDILAITPNGSFWIARKKLHA